MLSLNNRFFGNSPLIFTRAPAAPASLINVCELNQAVDLGAVFPTAFALDVISSSTSDAAAGTGLRTVEICGLDFAGNPLFETVAMNGQTAVTTTQQFWRVFGAQGVTFGTGRKNAGDIHIYKTGTGGTITGGVPGTLTSAVIKILANEVLGVSGFFTAPKGRQYILSSWCPGMRVQVGKHSVFVAAERVTPAIPPTLQAAIDTPVGVSVSITLIQDIYLNELEDIYFRVLSGAASGVASVIATLTKV